MRFLIAATVPFLLAASSSASEHWPAWRGPTGDGQSDETNLPLTWDGKSRKNILWSAPLFPSDQVKRDQNQSSPVVWGERVFVTLSYWPDGESKDYPEHHVHCYSTRDGARLWDVTVPPGPWKLTDLRGGYTAPTPATDGHHVYAVFGSSVVAAIDMQGKIVWRKEIKPHHFDVAWGASPVLYPPPRGDAPSTVILVCDHVKSNKSSTVLALDGKTGEVRWERKRPDTDWAHSTPLLARVGAKMQLLTATHHGPQGLDPETGKPLWWYHDANRIGDTVTPAYRDGLLYVDSGRGSMGIALDVTGAGDLSMSSLKWSIPKLGSGFSSPLLVGDHLYRLHGSDTISCWKWSTGEAVFKERLEGVDTAISPIATADGRIYCASAGKSYVLKAGPRLEVLAANTIGDANRSSPAVAAGRLYLKGSRFLYCVGSKR